MKKFFVTGFFFLVLNCVFGQVSLFEGTWSGKSPIALFFDTLEYIFSGNTWVLKKYNKGVVTETSEGTFTYTQDRIIMLQTRYKTTGDWRESQLQTGGNYRLDGNKLFLDGIEFTRTSQNPSSTSNRQTTNAGGLYYSITIPQNWTVTKNHRYLPQIREALGLNSAQSDYTEAAYIDSKNNNNFLFISEVAVPHGLTTAQLMRDSPATKVTYNGREFYVISEAFNRASTMKVAYIIFRDVLHGFFFVLENTDLSIAEQVFASIQFR